MTHDEVTTQFHEFSHFLLCTSDSSALIVFFGLNEYVLSNVCEYLPLLIIFLKNLSTCVYFRLRRSCRSAWKTWNWNLLTNANGVLKRTRAIWGKLKTRGKNLNCFIVSCSAHFNEKITYPSTHWGLSL